MMESAESPNALPSEVIFKMGALTHDDALPRLQVLVLDDNRDAADGLAALIRLWGHECFCEYEPMHAFEIAVIRQPDVIFSDIAMPAVNGFALAKMLRGQPGLRQPVLVAVSAYGDEDHRAEASECGFDHYHVKAAAPEGLRSLLAEIKRQRQAGSDHVAAGPP